MKHTMKNIKFLSLLLAVVGVVAFTSCKEEWTPGVQDANMGVYFPDTSRVDLTEDGTEAEIVVKRNNATEAASVKVRVSDVDNCGLFTVQGAEFEEGAVVVNVDFAAGAEESSIVFGYDGSELKIGTKYNFAIQLDQSSASIYGISDAVFTLAIPEPWVAWDDEGTQGIYFDECLCYIFADPAPFVGLGTYVDFEKHALNPNRVRAVNLFSKNNLATMWGGLPDWMTVEEGDEPHAIEFDISDPNNVKLASNPILLNLVVDGIRLGFYVQTKDDGSFVEPIVLSNGIIKFPVGLVALIAIDAASGEILGAYENNGNQSGYMQFYLPGTEFVDYAIAATYDGMYISPDGATAKAIFNFFLGVDVASYKFAFVEGDVTEDPSETVKAIVEGSKDLTIFESDVETTRYEIELPVGSYTLVAVPYTAEGEAREQDAYATNFYFNGAGDMPEVEVNVEVNTPAYFAEEDKKAEVEAESPACFNVACKVVADASQLKAVKFWYGNAQALVEQNIDDDTLFANYAGDASSMIAKLAENGAALMTFNVTAETPNFVVKLRFETIYGTSVDKTIEYELPKYDGAFPVGSYLFTEGDYKEVFTITPAKSYTTFFWTNTTFDGSSWYCNFDPETSILTMDGILFNYEDEGSQFGMLFGYYNQEGTLVYSYQSSENAELDGMAPLQLSVADGAMALKTYYAVAIFDYTGEAPAFTGNYHFFFSPEATIVPYVEEEAPETSAKVLSVAADKVEYAGAADKSEFVVKATPIYAFDFAMATLK